MKKALLLVLALIAVGCGDPPSDTQGGSGAMPPQTVTATDAEIGSILVQRSIAAYSGNCPCPYNRDSAGRQCGGRSAYSRPGGASPLCYPRDVSAEQVMRYRERNR
jgi:hypothetical protein